MNMVDCMPQHDRLQSTASDLACDSHQALGTEYVADSAAALATVVPELERMLNHGDVGVSVAGAAALGRIGAGDRVLEYCAEWLQVTIDLQLQSI